jgi:chondroitin 4-sulfotransferase 11
MIISHKYKFVFIAIPKTGTQSIAEFFIRLDPETIVVPKHAKISDLNKYLKSSKDYYKFCFVRNPFDRVVSMYYQWKKPLYIYKKERKYLFDLSNNNSFSEFIRILKEDRPDFWKDEIEFNYISIDNKLAVDFIGRFENLQEDFNKVCERLGINNSTLPKINSSKHRHYSNYYEEDTKKIISKEFKKDLDFFKYKFEHKYEPKKTRWYHRLMSLLKD